MAHNTLLEISCRGSNLKDISYFILVDVLIHIVIISMGLPILYFKG